MLFFTMHTTRPAPSMCQEAVEIVAIDYAAAVAKARASHAQTRRHTSLTGNGYCWFMIAADGTETNRSTTQV